jgi:hypothetical protein
VGCPAGAALRKQAAMAHAARAAPDQVIDHFIKFFTM